MDKQQEYVLRTVEDRDVRFIRLWFTDVLGFLKSFAITPAELEDAFERGMEFDGSGIEGFARVPAGDTGAEPGPATLTARAPRRVRRVFFSPPPPGGRPVRWRPPLGRAAQPGRGRRPRLHRVRRPRAGGLPVRRRRVGPAAGHRVRVLPDR